MGPGNRHEEEPLDEHNEGPDAGVDDDTGEDHDDERAGSRGPLPDPLDRVWLHPTELSMLGAAFAPSEPPGPSSSRHRLVWLTPLLAGAAGALLTVAVLAVTGSFDRSTTTAASRPPDDVTTTRAPSVADTLSRLSPSVVTVVATDAQGTRRGSGVCVRHGAQLLTSTRVVGSATTVDVVTSDGHQHTARVAGRDRVTDLVLLDLDDDAEVPAAPLADHAPPMGATVWLLGAPTATGKSPWMSGGMASSNDAMVVSDLGPSTSGLLETDAQSNAATVGRRTRRLRRRRSRGSSSAM